MTEAQRFIRFVLPGLTLFVEVWVLAAVSSWAEATEWVTGLMRDESLGAIIALFVISGGVGFLLSTVHHFLHWRLWIPLRIAAAPDSVQRAIDANLLNLVNQPARLPPRQQWQVLVSVWHQRRTTSPRIGAATERAESLADLMHGVGTVFVSSLLALVVWTALPSTKTIAGFLVGSVLILLHGASYWLVTRQAQGVVDMVLMDALKAESEGESAARAHFSAR